MTVDELRDYGMHQMDDSEIEGFLAAQSLGVLGLPTGRAPYLLPMSYGFDRESRLYFFYLVGSRSRKAELSERAETASFLVYSAETMFNWESAFLRGAIRKVPEEKRSSVAETMTPTWRPELFETASETEETRLYEFRIEEWTGIRHTGLPPRLFRRTSSGKSE